MNLNQTIILAVTLLAITLLVVNDPSDFEICMEKHIAAMENKQSGKKQKDSRAAIEGEAASRCDRRIN